MKSLTVFLYRLFHLAWDFVAFRRPFAQRVAACPICGSPGRRFRRYLIRSLDHCPSCSHVYTARVPRPAMLELIYSGFAYWRMDREKQGLRDVHDHQQWAGWVDSRLDILERGGLLRAEPPLRIFEIGCAEGVLMDALQRQGHRVEGCETNRVIAAFARQELGLSINDEPFESAAVDEAAYDMVLSYHTFEHLSDPAGALGKTVQMLKPDGGVCLEVPLGAEDLRNHDHLQFFTEESLRRFLAARFAEVMLFENPDCYRSGRGTVVGSLFGIGRRPLLE